MGQLHFFFLGIYRDASRATYLLGPPPSRGGDLELEGGVNVLKNEKVGMLLQKEQIQVSL